MALQNVVYQKILLKYYELITTPLLTNDADYKGAERKWVYK